SPNVAHSTVTPSYVAMNGRAGHASLRLTTRVTGPLVPSRWNTASTAPTPPAVQNGLPPPTPSRSPTALLREQTRPSRLRLPAPAPAPSALRAGSGNVSTTLSGPRLDALVAVGSYPSPAADGRDWKYCTSALPSWSVKDWPMTALPTVLPSAPLTSEPLALS